MADDLSEALRAFESGEADVGWIGSGLHRARSGSVKFDAGSIGWVILRTGNLTGAWGAPGVAEQLVNQIPARQLAYLGLEALPTSPGEAAWGGPPSELWVDRGAPHLVEIAKTLAGLLSRPGHELQVVAQTTSVLARARRSGHFAMMLDFVRRIGPDGPATLQALLAAENPALLRHPPHWQDFDARRIARTLPFGIVGELHVSGAYLPKFHDLDRWVLGNVWVAP